MTATFIRHTAAAAAAVIATLPVFGAAQSPTAQQILARHEVAVGGRKALEAHSSIRITGIVIIPVANARGSIEIVRAKPNRFVEKLSLTGLGEMYKGFDGKTAWVLEPQGAALLTDADAESVRRQADWYHEFATTQASRGARVDSADFEGQAAWMLTYASGLGDEVRSYFSQQTGLRLGETTHMGVGNTTIVYGAYREFGVIRMPTTITTRSVSGEMHTSIVTVEFDKVPASAFALPPAVKAIAKDD
jgi:hypothetical protein